MAIKLTADQQHTLTRADEAYHRAAPEHNGRGDAESWREAAMTAWELLIDLGVEV